MQYDFTTIMDRRGKDAIAVDAPAGNNTGNDFFAGAKIREGFDLIPMWVADMNFPALPAIPEAIIQRTKHPAYGYFDPSAAYYDGIINWQKTRNGVNDLTKECIGYENGVLGGVVSALKVLCSNGDSVLLQSPTYIGFTHCIEDNGWNIVPNPLVLDEEGIWRIDYEDMEEKIVQNKIHAAVFCSPHNPTGRVWERWEIEEAMEVYKNNECVVIADEIWSDLILKGSRHIPTQSISPDARNRTIAFYAPSKTFNLAGLVGSYHIVFNRMLRDRLEAKSRKSHYNTMNVLSMHALIGAYEAEGYTWVNELCQVLSENVEYAVNHIRDYYRGINVSKPQGTYMLFLDCEDWCEENYKSLDELLKAGWDVGVAWQDGRPFHQEYGIRMNLALPLSRVKEAFERLDEYVFHV